jgi:hypothetical protein
MRNPFRPRFILLDSPKLSEAELAGAFAMPVTDKRLLAILQVIGELEEQANWGAQKSVASHGMSASCNGGAEHMGMLRDRILGLREKGFGKSDS